MTSINGLGRSSMSSIYGNRNVISGLASGMDTEAMIENAIAGYKMKISSLQQKQTKVTWQQQALRSIIDKLADFSQKYTSYASSTNLLSSSFFNSSVKVSTHGTYADKVSATGKTNSTVQILGVKQLASAATYKSKLNGVTSDGSIQLGKVDPSQNNITVSNLTGSLTIANGDSASVTIELTEEDMAGVTDMAGLADKINAKLEEAKKNGGYKGEIKAVHSGNTITFTGTNNTYIKSISGKIRDTLDIESGEKPAKLSYDENAKKPWESKVTWADQVDGKEISITLDGVTKRFTLNAVDEKGNELDYADVMDGLKKEIESAFNKKVTMEGDSSTGWKLGVAAGSTLSVSSSVGKLLGMDSNNETSYTNMNKTLGELLEGRLNKEWAKADQVDASALTHVKDDLYKDKNGNMLKKEGDSYYRVNDEGNKYLYDFKLNGKTIGSFTEDSTLESVISAINKNSEAGVDVSFSKISNEFQFTSRETGSQGKIEMKGLAAELFGKAGGDVEVEGKDAIFSMAVNGKVFDGISRSGNTFDVDGLQVSLKGTFGDYVTNDPNDDPNALNVIEKLGKDEDKIKAVGDNAVSFTTAADSVKIVDTIKKFAEDYNAMVKEIKDAYATLPLQKSNGASYEPLTSDELEGMSETEIKNYEEKAKQGLLFGDRDLSNLYNQLTNSFNSNTALKKIGIEVSYSNGLSTLTVNEEKLRAALDSDPEQVQEAFTSAAGNGKTMMESMKETLDRYGSVVGTKGILVDRAGSSKAASTLLTNTMQKTIDNFETQIQKWTDKMTDQVDRYTRQFSQLEQLIAQMNAQSSSLSGLMGGF
ncbi:flagellar filament capping protein FliD [uncultured Intestinimonas sp.]|uniref:flagellar filament capping protein FliD n=1 Tax=uncultured Intestinimonas sp. TaxID=1689265 RepID=UPI002943392D|nr:flagellar filament capping protein FliD [uncultured Intestinimonas sp.]